MAVDFAIVDVDAHWVGRDEAQQRLHTMEAALADMRGPLREIVSEMYAHTKEWMDSWGDGTYDPLSPSTIADKMRLHYDDPARPLFATGELLESASTPAGPFSAHDVYEHEAWIGVDWERDGWNIPALHQEGVPWRVVHRRSYVTRAGKHVGAATYLWHLPARPIFTIDDELVSFGGDEIVAHVFNPLA